MAGHPHPRVDEGRIAPVRLAERPPEALRRLRRQDQMDVAEFEALGYPTSRNVLPGALSAAAEPLMKATRFVGQNTNDHLFVRRAGRNCEKKPACEGDSNWSVDQRKNDGVDHVSL
jgi:hypothetical protein